jgi:hypothetical protein
VSSETEGEVPYSEDLQDPSDARAWVEAADRKRPLRVHISDALFLLADRVPEDDLPRSTALFMTEQEQTRALAGAGFHDVRVVMSGDALVLCQCRKAARG